MVDVVPIDLALQGGGAHCAFTWGGLDRFLDERGLHYVAISGASAGAINAVVFAEGLLSGGRTGAQKALWAFWKAISRAAHGAQPANNPFYAFFLTTGGQLPRWLTSGPWAASIDAMAQVRGFPHTDFLSLPMESLQHQPTRRYRQDIRRFPAAQSNA